MLKTISWVLLAIVAALTLLGSLASLRLAYAGDPATDIVGLRATVRDIADWRPDVATAVRARRGTAAAFAAGYAVLLLAIVLVPYRRGEVWAWWAILGASLTIALLTFLRLPLLHTRAGAGTGAVQLGVTALALLLDAGRLGGRRAPAAAATAVVP